MNFKISEELANAILNYLGSRPYVESAKLIGELQKIKPIEEEANELVEE